MPWSPEVAVSGAIDSGLLVQVVAVESAIVVVGLALFLGHAVWGGLTAPRAARRLERGRHALHAALDQRGASTAELRPLSELPRRRQIELLAALAPSLAGEQRRLLTGIAEDLGILAYAAKRCRSRLWWRRLQGARLFTLLGSGHACVPALLDDPTPEVRAEAVRWAVEHHDDAIVERLLLMLDADEPPTRFAVKDALIRVGRSVTRHLARHLANPAGPSSAPALEVAVAVADSTLLPAGLRLCQDGAPRVRALAARLVGAVGGDPAMNTLMDLLRDDAAEVRAAAARTLGKAGHWPAAAPLSRLLGDSSWDVRRQAGMALRSLGSPGTLFLRRALSSEDPFAADAARQMLDLPESATRRLER